MCFEYFQPCDQHCQTKVVVTQLYGHKDEDEDSGEFDSFKTKLVNKFNFF